MEHLDRLIPLPTLAVVAAFVLFLLWRTVREERTMTPSVEPLPVPIPIETPQPAQVSATEINSVRRKRRRKPAVAVKTAPVHTPIHMALGLLKEKDTLAAAFLLREILAPPVSKR